MKTTLTRSIGDLKKTAEDLVSNAIILEPGKPAEILADEIVEEADEDFLAEFTRTLAVGFFTRTIRGQRTKARRARIPEEFRHLPLRIRLPDGTVVRLDKITYSQARRYCQSLGKRLDERRRNDPRLGEAKVLMERLHRAQFTKGDGITAGEVWGFDFGS